MKIELVPDAESGNPKAIAAVVVGQTLTIQVRLKNIGRTPAEDVRSAFAIQIAGPNDELFLPPDMTNPPHKENPKHWFGVTTAESGAIFPDQFHDLPIPKVGGCPNNCGPIVINQDELNQLRSGTALIYLEGTSTYTDGFGKHHWTRFCTAIPSLHNGQASCVHYNRADSNY